MITKREFRLIGLGIDKDLTLNELFGKNQDDYEYIYALQEDYGDEILDLKVTESLFVQLNRDDINDKGVLVRVS